MSLHSCNFCLLEFVRLCVFMYIACMCLCILRVNVSDAVDLGEMMSGACVS